MRADDARAGRGSDRPRVVIVTPGQLGSNPRVVKEADALIEAGCAVRVVCARVADFVESRDRAILTGARFAVDRVAFDRKLTWYADRLLQTASRRTRTLAPTLATADFALSAMTRRLLHAAAARPADLYIAHYVAALPAAARAARRCGARYAFDAEDFHLGDLPDHAAHAGEKCLIRDIEGAYLPGAAYVTAASPLIADAYAEAYGITPPTTVLNVFPRTNALAAPTPKGTVEPGPSLYWFSQTIGPGRGLETAIAAIAQASHRPHLYLRGTPASGYVAALQSLAAANGVGSRLHFLPPAAPPEMERLGSVYDLGFVGEQPLTLNRRIALTNKLFSYWMSGLPTLVSDIPAHRPFIAQHPDFVRTFTDPASLAAALDDLLGDPSRLMGARAAAYGAAQERYNWDRESYVLRDVVLQALDVVRPERHPSVRQSSNASVLESGRLRADSVVAAPCDRCDER